MNHARDEPDELAGLHALATAAGIAVHWTDAFGTPQTVAPHSLRAVLDALELPNADAAQRAASLARLRAEHEAAEAPPLLLASVDRPIALGRWARPLAGQTCRVELEEGGVLDRRISEARPGAAPQAPDEGTGADSAIAADASLSADASAWLAPIDRIGYHRLFVGPLALTLAVAPPRCYGVADAVAARRDWRDRGAASDAPGNGPAGPRLWALAAQLYSLRREGDGGLGDYTALAELAEAAARQGAAALAISPVHAMFCADPGRYSPYGPSSRLMHNVLHVDGAHTLGTQAWREALQALAQEDARHAGQARDDGRAQGAGHPGRAGHGGNGESLPTRLARLEAAERIDWPEVSRLKLRLLRRLYLSAAFRDSASLQAAFAAFRREGGDALEHHARFEALHAHFNARSSSPGGGWRSWPDEFRDPRSPAVQSWAEAHADEVGLHAFMQWLAARGLAGAQARARAAGMPIGLIADLAVGADGDGSQSWSRQGEMLNGLSVGAPPDVLNVHGQSWGLAAFSPRAMARHGYGAWIEMLRATLRHAGGVRIDHVLGLARLWLVPHGLPATEGAYLSLPIDDLLRLVALESWRARAIVIGEDLGTVPADFPARMQAAGVLGMRVLWFQREGEGFVAPAQWSDGAVAMTGTHDLPSVAGWWQGRDIDWRTQLALLPHGVSEPQEREQRARDRAALWRAVQQAGCADAGSAPAPPDAPPVADVLGFVAASPAPLVIVPLEDALGLLEQPNLPGTTAVHPNWLQRLAVPAARLLDAPAVRARLAAVGRTRSVKAKGSPTPWPETGAQATTARNAPAAVPRATARLQLHAGFTLDDAADRVDYFHRLGISHLYVSPLTTSRAGSTHGYDVVDPTRIDPELGGSAALRRLVARLREHGMGVVADIVPNHMGVAGPGNAWWQDVLAWGRASPHAPWFDIDWEPDDPALQGKLLAPFLGQPYGETLAEGHLRLSFDPQQGRFHCAYHDHRFPIAPGTHADVLMAGEGSPPPALAPLIEGFAHLGAEPHAQTLAQWQTACDALAAFASTAAGRTAIDAVLARHDPHADEGRTRLHALLERQHYRLAWWRCAADQINWRRFFEVSDLAGLAVEREDVFEASHALIFELYAAGLIDGLRVDHIDGLADPERYCLDLRRRLSALQASRPEGLREGRPYVVVEKILAVDEALPASWQTDGTSGYDFMDQVGALLHHPAGAEPLADLWREFSGRPFDFEEEALQARRQILAENLAAEREACALAFRRVARSSLGTRDWALGSIRRVLAELLVHFPVYRCYPGPAGRSTADRGHLAHAAAGARDALRSADHALLGQLVRWLGEAPASELHRKALTRFEQLSAPLTAKSVEDTAFYRYGRLLSRNEVGSDPARLAIDAAAFHGLGTQRARDWPAAMLATATHDHKRGEDLRARLAVLSELPGEWAVTARHWRELNAPARAALAHGVPMPPAGHELMLYQMLLGAWPLGLQSGDREGLAAFAERIAAWQTKALREAKQITGWTAPDEARESACRSFLMAILGLENAAPASAEFVATLAGFVERIAPAGALGGLSQCLLRMAVPGVPDLYQGCEWWDFSLVDPDNRAPVDYAARQSALAQEVPVSELLSRWRDGRIKQAVIRRALGLRGEKPALFAGGDYLPLTIEGPLAGHAIAFARCLQGDWVLAVASLHAASLLPAVSAPLVPADTWADTAVSLPPSLEAPPTLSDALTLRTVRCAEGRVFLSEALKDLPVALLALR